MLTLFFFLWKEKIVEREFVPFNIYSQRCSRSQNGSVAVIYMVVRIWFLTKFYFQEKVKYKCIISKSYKVDEKTLVWVRHYIY